MKTLTAGTGVIKAYCAWRSALRPRGCIAQAWSVAETLRTRLEIASRSPES